MRTIATASLDVRPLGGRSGAELHGIRPAEDLARGVLELLKDALLEHKILILPGQDLDGPSHTRLLRRLGTPDSGSETDIDLPDHAWLSPGSHRLAPPKVFSIRADGAFDGEAVRIADVGGAYRDLPRPLRALADRTWALHSASRPAPDASPGEQVAHPVTRLHTETGERGLLVGANARQVLGLADAESRTLLDLLQSFVARPHNVHHPAPAEPAVVRRSA